MSQTSGAVDPPAWAATVDHWQFVSGVLGDSHAVVGYATALVAAVEEGIGDLWRAGIDGCDRRLSDCLLELSQAPRRATLVFAEEPAIGRSGRSVRSLPDASLPV